MPKAECALEQAVQTGEERQRANVAKDDNDPVAMGIADIRDGQGIQAKERLPTGDVGRHQRGEGGEERETKIAVRNHWDLPRASRLNTSSSTQNPQTLKTSDHSNERRITWASVSGSTTDDADGDADADDAVRDAVNVAATPATPAAVAVAVAASMVSRQLRVALVTTRGLGA
ncbi:hypothetical protein CAUPRSCDRAFT_11740 [Caulochytrium protostelioides]|uniref:Uncharacterized protein n=1 Tax=Caulochytrium protostelioides TaxID=1555241 RepID=A0A4P9WTF6_9FUNG|nr:hypothetical protein CAUPRSCDRAFT_11740 [Caulochytrium protostelioides]